MQRRHILNARTRGNVVRPSFLEVPCAARPNFSCSGLIQSTRTEAAGGSAAVHDLSIGGYSHLLVEAAHTTDALHHPLHLEVLAV